MNKRFLSIIEELNLNDSSFCKFIGHKRVSTLYEIRKDEKDVSFEILVLLKKRLPHLNLNYLYNDQEPMFLTPAFESPTKQIDKILEGHSINNAALSQKMGYARFKVDRVRSGTDNINVEFLTKLKDEFPTIDLNYLLIEGSPFMKTISIDAVLKELRCLKN